MVKLNLLYLTLFFFTSVVPCQTWQDYYKSVKQLEVVGNASRDLKLEFIDKRWSKDYSFDLNKFKENINALLSVEGLQILETNYVTPEIRPVDMKVEIAYLNFYESGAGGLFGKGILDLKLKDPYNRNIKEVTVSSSLPFNDGDIDDYFDPEYSFQFLKWQNLVDTQLANRLHMRISEYFEETSTFKEVTSFGKAPMGQEFYDYEKFAIIDALQNATARVTGLKLENITTLVDFSEVTDRTTTSATGLILDYKLLPEFTKVTQDSVYCVIVKAIIKDEY